MHPVYLIPRIRFSSLPTPVEPLPRLSASLGGPNILVKRDDLTGLAMGGNKTRKLEFVLAEALANGARTLITVGAAQSNHCRQTAAIAARMGLDCILVLSGKPDGISSGNLLLDELFGAEVIWTTYEDRSIVLKNTFDAAWESGRRPYLIPLGASNALGSLAYEAAFQEFVAQEIPVDWIVVASASGGTQAGLVLGANWADWKGRILGISIAEPASDLVAIVFGLAERAAERAGKPLSISPGDILVDDHYLGAGYGVVGQAEIKAIQLFARFEGLLLDPVYTGRAAAGLIDLCRKKFFKPGERVLFWHTGGTPALFADLYSPTLIEG